MVITALKQELRDALGIVERFAGKQLTLPIIGNILLKASGHKIKLVATNLEMGAEVSIPAKVAKEGMITIPPKVLSALLQSLKEEKITLEERQGSLFIETDSSQTEIRGIPGKDFPIIPIIEEGIELSLLNKELIPQINRVLPSITPSDFKPEISGVLFKIKKHEVVITGTDTFRLTETKIKEFKSNADDAFIIPLRPIQELARIASESGSSKFNFKDGQVLIEIDGNVKIISRLISGKYPDYDNLIPKEFSTTIRVPKLEVLDSIRLSGVFSTKLNDIILTYRQNRLIIEITNPEIGKFTKEVGVKTSGKSGRLGFNYRYLTDALEAVNSNEALLSMTDETKPALVQDESDQLFFTLLMPIRMS